MKTTANDHPNIRRYVDLQVPCSAKFCKNWVLCRFLLLKKPRVLLDGVVGASFPIIPKDDPSTQSTVAGSKPKGAEAENENENDGNFAAACGC